jgi:hypothetical protein
LRAGEYRIGDLVASASLPWRAPGVLTKLTIPGAGEKSAAANTFRKPMLYPLSYEGLTCVFAQHAGQVSAYQAWAGCLAPDGLCRTCAACCVSAISTFPRLPLKSVLRATRYETSTGRRSRLTNVGSGVASRACAAGGRGTAVLPRWPPAILPSTHVAGTRSTRARRSSP